LSSKKSMREEIFYEGVKNRIVILIERCGSQVELARRAGINVQRINNYIKGIRTPDIEGLSKIARAMNVTTDWLLFGDEDVEKKLDRAEGICKDGDVPGRKNDLEEFSERLKALMAERGLSASDLAEIIGVKRQVISNWLTAKNWPRDSAMKKLAKLFGVSKWDLAAGGGVPEPKETVYLDAMREVKAKEGAYDGPGEKRVKVFQGMLYDMRRDERLADEILNFYEYLKSKKRRKAGND